MVAFPYKNIILFTRCPQILTPQTCAHKINKHKSKYKQWSKYSSNQAPAWHIRGTIPAHSRHKLGTSQAQNQAQKLRTKTRHKNQAHKLYPHIQIPKLHLTAGKCLFALTPFTASHACLSSPPHGVRHPLNRAATWAKLVQLGLLGPTTVVGQSGPNHCGGEVHPTLGPNSSSETR